MSSKQSLTHTRQAAIIAKHYVNSVVHRYLSPTPVGVGVGTSLTLLEMKGYFKQGIYGQLTRLSLPARVWLRETIVETMATARSRSAPTVMISGGELFEF